MILSSVLQDKGNSLAKKAEERIHWWSRQRWSSVITLTPDLTTQEPLWSRSEENLSPVRLFGLTPAQLQDELCVYWSKPLWQQWLLNHFTFINKKIEIFFYYQQCLAFQEIKTTAEIENDEQAIANPIFKELEKGLLKQEADLDKKYWDLIWKGKIALLEENFHQNHTKIKFFKKLYASLKKIESETERSQIEVTIKARYEKMITTMDNYYKLCTKKLVQTREIIKAFKVLHAAGILTPKNRTAVQLYLNIDSFIDMLESLQSSQILSEENLEQILLYPYQQIENISVIIWTFHHGEMLTQENLHVVLSHPEPFILLQLFYYLDQEKLLPLQNKNIAQWNLTQSDLFQGVKLLYDAGLLTQENFEAIQSHPWPSMFAKAIFFLHRAQILSVENRNAIALHPWTENMALVIYLLQDTNLLTQENFDLIRLHPQIAVVSQALYALQYMDILTQENLTALFEASNLLREGIWERIPRRLVTVDVFNALLQRAHQENANHQIQFYIDDLLNLEIENRQPINQEQSTHTESVHQSVSKSATQLLSRYGDQIKGAGLVSTIVKLSNFIANLPDSSQKNKAAKSWIKRVLTQDFIFTDPSSGISLLQLLALSYLAIRDETVRYGELKDAENQWIEGLYEIQRGDNLSAEGKDDEKEDNPVCISGSFNKLIEKLQGIHPDCEVLFITKELASLKLPIIVRNAAMRYLSALAEPEKAADFLRFTDLMQQLKVQGIEVIWDNIKDDVANELFKEFASLYKDPKNNNFIALVNAGPHTALSDETLISFQEKIQNSNGYNRYCSQTLRQGKLFSFSAIQNQLKNLDNQPIHEKPGNYFFMK